MFYKEVSQIWEKERNEGVRKGENCDVRGSQKERAKGDKERVESSFISFSV